MCIFFSTRKTIWEFNLYSKTSNNKIIKNGFIMFVELQISANNAIQYFNSSGENSIPAA